MALKQMVVVAGSGDYTGACKMAHLYGKALRDAGWEVLFIVGDPPTGDALRLADILRQDEFSVSEEQGFFRLRDRGLISRVREKIASFSPQFVLSTVQIDLKIVGPACRSLGIPYLVFDQTVHRFYGPAPLRWLKRAFFARELRLARGVIAVGPAVRDQVVQEFDCQSERVSVVPNGIVTSEYRYPSVPFLRSADPPLRALNIGRIDPQKGQRILVRAMKLLRGRGINLSVDLAGGVTPSHPASESYHRELLDDLREHGLGDAVRLLGWRSDVASLLVEYDFYVHSAIWEGPPLPLSVLEAMASGLPVILTNCVGRPEGFVDDIHGRVVKAGDAGQLADALEWMCCLSGAERLAIGENCRRLAVERYDVAVTGKQFVEHCERALCSAG